MAEYIEREALLKRLDMAIDCKNCPRCVDMKTYYDRCAYTDIQDVCGVISDIPAADVQPVKRGYWEEVTDYSGWGDTHYRCSVCGEEWYLEDGKPKDNNMNFCPRCGARMDGEQNV